VGKGKSSSLVEVMMFKCRTRKVVFGLGIFFLLIVLEGKAISPLQMKLELGFEGFYKIGAWTPLRIVLENRGSSVEGTLLVKLAKGNLLTEDSAETIYSIPVFLPSSSRKLYQVNIPLETDIHPLKLSLVSDKKTLLKKEVPLQPFYIDKGFILVVNKSHAGFNFLTPSGLKRIRQVLYTDPDKLPNRWIGYDAIQTLIIDDLESFELTSEQEKAIEEWLSIGGKLIITARGGYGKFKSSLFSHLLPLESLKKVYIDSSFSSLQDKYGTFTDNFQKVELWNSQWQRGEVLIEEKGIPLLVKLKLGAGEIFFLAFNSFQPPFKNWPGKPYLWAEMLEEKVNFSVFNQGILDSVIESSFFWPGRLYPERKEIAFFLLIYFVAIALFYWCGGKTKLGWGLRFGLIISAGLFALIFSLFWGTKMQRENTFLEQISIFYKKEEGSLAKTENYFAFFSSCPQSVEAKFDRKISFVTALSAPSGKQKLFKDLVVFPYEGKIHWSPSSRSSNWSFHLFRLETISHLSLITKVNRGRETITVNLQNLNSFPLQDLLLLYGEYSSFLKELPAFSEANLTLNLKEKKTLLPLFSIYSEESESKDPQIKLRKKIFEQMWDFTGPLKNMADRFPVLLAWFEKAPQTLVKINQSGNFVFLGLVIIPFSGS